MTERVLIVDDSYVMRNLIKKIMRDADYEVVGEAISGEDAIAQLASLDPTLITMDINMPGIGGIKATRDILSAYPEMGIIAVTGERNPEIRKEMMDAGAISLVKKPFQPAYLLERIDEWIVEKTARPQLPPVIEETEEAEVVEIEEFEVASHPIERPDPNLHIQNQFTQIVFEDDNPEDDYALTKDAVEAELKTEESQSEHSPQFTDSQPAIDFVEDAPVKQEDPLAHLRRPIRPPRIQRIQPQPNEAVEVDDSSDSKDFFSHGENEETEQEKVSLFQTIKNLFKNQKK